MRIQWMASFHFTLALMCGRTRSLSNKAIEDDSASKQHIQNFLSGSALIPKTRHINTCMEACCRTLKNEKGSNSDLINHPSFRTLLVGGFIRQHMTTWEGDHLPLEFILTWGCTTETKAAIDKGLAAAPFSTKEQCQERNVPENRSTCINIYCIYIYIYSHHHIYIYSLIWCICVFYMVWWLKCECTKHDTIWYPPWNTAPEKHELAD